MKGHSVKLDSATIVDLYVNKKLNAIQISDMYGVSHSYIYTILNKANVQRRITRHNLTDEELNRLIKLYTIDHWSSVDIGKEFGMSFPTVIRILKQNNIPIVDSRHDRSFRKNRISDNELPPFVTRINNTTGEVICPICHQKRTLHIDRLAIEVLNRYNGVCKACIPKIPKDEDTERRIIKDYVDGNLSTRQLSTIYKVARETIYTILSKYNVHIRKKGELRKKKLNNKGTINNPCIGDICDGKLLGHKNGGYYIYVRCPKCNYARWQVINERKNNNPICYPCASIKRGLEYRGEKAPVWRGGLSRLPYVVSFNNPLKESVRNRDNRECQLCGIKENGRKIDVHHIDYNKKNSHTDNLICLCHNKCHTKTNHNREFWTAYFQEYNKERKMKELVKLSNLLKLIITHNSG